MEKGKWEVMLRLLLSVLFCSWKMRWFVVRLILAWREGVWCYCVVFAAIYLWLVVKEWSFEVVEEKWRWAFWCLQGCGSILVGRRWIMFLWMREWVYYLFFFLCKWEREIIDGRLHEGEWTYMEYYELDFQKKSILPSFFFFSFLNWNWERERELNVRAPLSYVSLAWV